jgi:hypothetical protein
MLQDHAKLIKCKPATIMHNAAMKSHYSQQVNNTTQSDVPNKFEFQIPLSYALPGPSMAYKYHGALHEKV